ncbi:MAG: Ppx/GppA family phosphatase [Alphaproteobacteria bacterium]|nr:Ppx/GppA family phosphatase [Alphaproteobacteria bacterium]
MINAALPPSDPSGRARIGIIDIGSNSVRLVVFDALARSPVSLFNEKVLCGLARSLDKSGRLDRAGTKQALATIQRFVALASAMEVSRLELIATAAVREATDGEEFVATVRTQFGARVQILSGADEARLVGLSVAAAVPGADGVVGDLGGGSLELVEVEAGRIRNNTTLPLGTLRLRGSDNRSPGKVAKQVDAELEKVAWLKRLRKRTFYPIGGAWRSLARLDMAQRGYRLPVVDQYTMSRKEAETVSGVIQGLGAKSLRGVDFISTARLATLPRAALIMNRILVGGGPSRLVFCASGIREGYLFGLLSTEHQQQDPLIAACRSLAGSINRFGILGDELFAWTHPLFEDEDPEQSRYRHATCLLADWAWSEHPNSRADSALHRALQLSIPGISHRERCMVALALHYRYGAPVGGAVPEIPKAILVEKDIDAVQRLGLALRLAMSISGGAHHVVDHSALAITKTRLSLRYDDDIASLMGNLAARRLKALGQQMKLETRLAQRRNINSASGSVERDCR